MKAGYPLQKHWTAHKMQNPYPNYIRNDWECIRMYWLRQMQMQESNRKKTSKWGMERLGGYSDLVRQNYLELKCSSIKLKCSNENFQWYFHEDFHVCYLFPKFILLVSSTLHFNLSPETWCATHELQLSYLNLIKLYDIQKTRCYSLAKSMCPDWSKVCGRLIEFIYHYKSVKITLATPPSQISEDFILYSIKPSN